MMKAWTGFKGDKWKKSINVRDFIMENMTPYSGDEKFLEKVTNRTLRVMNEFETLLGMEAKSEGVLSINTKEVSSLLSYEPGYLSKDDEIIVGLQTSKALERGVNPFGGIRMARQAVESYGQTLSPSLEDHFAYKTTHNDGVFRVYSETMKTLRKEGVITGLPDAYGRGRIIGDYRRVALYGVDRLILAKKADQGELQDQVMTEETIKRLEELYREIDFLAKLKVMAKAYGFDISGPARNGKEAVQWTYFAYLGAIKEQNGAAMSLGRVSTFFDCYFERDLKNKSFSESELQEIMDDFVIKLRMARQLRTPEYNELFAGDPMWITEVIGGMSNDGRTLVTKSSYRILASLEHLNPAPEPNLTVLWSKDLPQAFKRYCAKLSINTSSIQYENDDLMRPRYGDDYGIACCVSAMEIGKEMQFFGARCNLPKLLLIAIEGGKGIPDAPQMPSLVNTVIDAEAFTQRFDVYMEWLAKQYVNTMNVIHYMHDKYAYEKLQMALHDTFVKRNMAFGIAGISVVADSFSSIKNNRVIPRMNEKGSLEFEGIQSYPMFGNDIDSVDTIAVNIVEKFEKFLKKTPAYRGANHTLSLLTITSNVVYGKKTGATPDGRLAGEPFAPGANPLHERAKNGAIRSLSSVAKLPYDACRDGISNTFSMIPSSLGTDDKTGNLVRILDGYFSNMGHHLNINILDPSQLKEAMNEPDKYPNLTIRVSGYAVKFHKLTEEQQTEVIRRTYHEEW